MRSSRGASAPPAARTSSTRTPSSIGLNPAFRREAQNVGGIFAQDQWRINPELTLNYGLRWELSGAGHEHQRRLQRPDARRSHGTLDGALPARHAERHRRSADLPAAEALQGATSSTRRRTSASRGTRTSPAAGSASCSVRASIGANFGVNYYDEGLINFQTVRGQRPRPEPDPGAAAVHARDR